jgi:hypothetical protein
MSFHLLFSCSMTYLVAEVNFWNSDIVLPILARTSTRPSVHLLSMTWNTFEEICVICFLTWRCPWTYLYKYAWLRKKLKFLL